MVLEKGFAYAGKTFASLSEIATRDHRDQMEWPPVLRPAIDQLSVMEATAMPADQPESLRCAIYTRKSTEHGLEQEFNSLDAQREACEAYIKSQASQGWKAPAPAL